MSRQLKKSNKISFGFCHIEVSGVSRSCCLCAIKIPQSTQIAFYHFSIWVSETFPHNTLAIAFRRKCSPSRQFIMTLKDGTFILGILRKTVLTHQTNKVSGKIVFPPTYRFFNSFIEIIFRNPPNFLNQYGNIGD